MRVSHVIHALGAGGAEEVLVELASVARSEGLDLSVVALTGDARSLHARSLRSLSIDVVTLGATSRWDPRVVPAGFRALAAQRPDVVHSHMKHADLVAAVVAPVLRVPWVSTLHVIDTAPGPLEPAKRWLAGQARRRLAASTIAVSEAQRAWYLATFPAAPDSVQTIYNGVGRPPQVTEEGRREVRASLGVYDDRLVAANVAIMRPGKGHEDLFRALTMLPESAELVVLLVGDGPERWRLEALAHDHGLVPRRVRFLGYRSDVAEILSAVDLLVHPSHTDALPTALIKALGAGVPIVASDVGGIPEIVADGCGILVPARAPERLADGLHTLIGDAEARVAMGQAGRRRFDRLFESRTWARRLLDLYETTQRQHTALGLPSRSSAEAPTRGTAP